MPKVTPALFRGVLARRLGIDEYRLGVTLMVEEEMTRVTVLIDGHEPKGLLRDQLLEIIRSWDGQVVGVA